jgi:Mg-chelatase subunit ChlD
VTVDGPGGVRRDIAAGAPAPVAGQPGFWTVREEGRPDRLLAVNADPAESVLEPQRTLPIRRAASRPGDTRPAGQVSLLPWAAAALLVLLAVEFLMSRRSSGAPRRQQRVAAVLRAAGAGLVVLSLLGAGLTRPGRRVATIFLVDASDSMGAAGRGEAVEWVQEALERQPSDALAGVALFGADTRVELTMQSNAVLGQPAARVAGSGTNLANALRLAGAVLPGDSRRRVVVVSDGRLTDGDAAAEIKRLEADGIGVDVHPILRAGSADVAVSRLEAPPTVREGEAFEVRATITATSAGDVHLTLQRDGTTVEQRTVAVEAGDTVVDFEQPPGTEGVHRFRLSVEGAQDGVPENDVGFAAVRIGGRERVLVAEGANGNSRELVAALRSSGLPVDVVQAVRLPGVEQLSTYSATVLVDVEAQSLSPDQVQALGAATRELGRGLVVVGGDRSYSLGGYLGSELEKLLPLESEIKDPIRRQSVAEVLAIDTSGSMGACHCNPNGTDGGMIAPGRGGGGINKTDISRAGAARAISVLSAQDEVGVLAFNTEQRWVVPLQQLPAADVVERGLQGLSPGGGTNIHNPLEVAAKALRDSKAKLKHIILFTDGWTNQEGLAAQAARMYEEGITISVLATGEGPGDELKSVAEAGHGRFYPGRNLEQVPQIMMQEAALASRNLVNEGEYFPRVLAQSGPVGGLTESPALLGYLGTTAKASAATLLDVGTDHDPLLATWRIGLGKVTAWTSDASQRWSKRWAAWGGYTGFWSAVVKDAFPLGGSQGAGIRAEVSDGRLRVSAESEQPWPDGAEASAHVATPGGGQVVVPLERTSATTFAGDASASGAGTYAVGVELRPGAGTGAGTPLLVATAFASQSYSPEYRPSTPDRGALERLSRLGGGRGAIAASAAFDQAGLPAGRRHLPLAAWLLGLAALLWPVDVALRRLALHGAVARAATQVRERLTPAARLRHAGAAGAPGPVAPPKEPSPRKGRKAEVAAPAPPETVQRLLRRKRGITTGESDADEGDVR